MLAVAQLNQIENQIFENQQEVAYDTREFIIETLVSKYKTGIEDDDNEIYVPEYQREFIWSKQQQAELIESIILGLPIPFIFIAEIRDTGRLEIVDGSQRIRTLAKFLDNELKLENLDILTNLNGLYFKDLGIPRQRKLKNTTIRTIVLSDKATEQVRIEMFRRINLNYTALTDMEVRKGLFRGDFINFIYQLYTDNELFHKLYPSNTNIKDRQGQELILCFFAFFDKHPDYQKGLSNFLDEYLQEKNSIAFPNIEKEEKTILFQNMLKFVDKHFPKGFVKPSSKSTRASKIYFEAVSVGVALAIQEKPELLEQDSINLDWITSQEFKKIVEPVFNTHSPKGIKDRINFVKNSLLGTESENE